MSAWLDEPAPSLLRLQGLRADLERALEAFARQPEHDTALVVQRLRRAIEVVRAALFPLPRLVDAA